MSYSSCSNIFVSCVLIFVTNVSASVILPTSFITQLTDIDINRDYNANNHEYIGIVNLQEKNPCTGEAKQFAYFLQETNQINKQELVDKLVELDQNNKNVYYRVTLESCDLKKLKFKNIRICNSEICPEKYVFDKKIWLNGDYKPTLNIDTATYFVQLPLEKDKKKNLWVVNGWFAKDIFNEPVSNTKPTLAFKGYTHSSKFKDRKFVNEFTRYYYNGSIANRSYYNKEGLLNGESLTYYASGKLYQNAFAINGQLEGLIVTLYENGTEESRIIYHQGKVIDGPCIHYFDNGKISRKHSYLNGEYDGESIEYDLDGRVIQKSIYNNGKQIESIYNKYTSRGGLKQREIYTNGVQRIYQTWQEDGIPSIDWRWDEEHKKIGEQKTWYSNGQLEKVKLYNNGQLMKQTIWSKNGNKLYEDDFYPNEKLKESKRWDNNYKLIRHQFYDLNDH